MQMSPCQQLDRVVVFCSARDFHLAELCVSSIRFWNKGIHISLHKDESRQAFDTSILEETFRVELCDSSTSSAGSPLSKLLYITQGADVVEGERLLILDADTAWFGDVAKLFDCIHADIIVQGEHDPSEGWIDKNYFDPKHFLEKHPFHSLPKIVFNTGHLVIRIGSLSISDFQDVLTQEPSGAIVPRTFIRLWDQGALNYVVARLINSDRLTLSHMDFAYWSRLQPDFQNCSISPFLIHWAGTVMPLIEEMDHARHLKDYRSYYLSVMPSQHIVRTWRRREFTRRSIVYSKRFIKALQFWRDKKTGLPN
jgi:hypothetical protein